ncbi:MULTISPECIES: DUF5786 family protein [Haloprofundus]|uniref:DUF5786 family protein n=1 Tax=Haloprofundus TaxID=1911573 RepID=UPI000E447BF4|nr:MULTISPECIES: DUF5786 family protein [Haloprofundus]QCJ46704.1 death domain-associated protein [Haloprofundus sp. MHR1]
MGFGSYDESEQRDQTVNADADEGVSVHEKDHDGKVTFDSDASTDDLLSKLEDIKAADADD